LVPEEADGELDKVITAIDREGVFKVENCAKLEIVGVTEGAKVNPLSGLEEADTSSLVLGELEGVTKLLKEEEEEKELFGVGVTLDEGDKEEEIERVGELVFVAVADCVRSDCDSDADRLAEAAGVADNPIPTVIPNTPV